jgi:hypothetical protein
MGKKYLRKTKALDQRKKVNDDSSVDKRAAKHRFALKLAKSSSISPILKTTSIDIATASLFQQTNHSNPNPKTVGHVSDRHRILVVGDGDFSFSLALATQLVNLGCVPITMMMLIMIHDSETILTRVLCLI